MKQSINRLITCCFALLIFLSPNLLNAQTLRDVVITAIENNPDVLINAHDHLALKQALEQARAGYFPKINTSISYGVATTRNSSTIGTPAGPVVTMPRRQANITLDQVIFDGFATKGEVARNSARVEAAFWRLESAMDTVSFNTATDYLKVIKEIELVKLAELNLRQHRAIMRVIKLRTDSGLAKESDLVQVKGRVALAEANLLAELSNLADAKANYQFRVGELPGHLEFPSPLPRAFMPKTEAEAEELAENHATVRSADADIKAAYQQHRVSKSSNFPRFDLQMGYTRDRNVGGVRGPSFDQFASMRMTYNLFSGGSSFARQRETAYLYQAAMDVRARSYRQARETTKLAWSRMITAFMQLPYLKVNYLDSGKTIEAYKKQFQIGQRTLLDLLDVQNEFFASSRSYVEGRYQILQSQYQLLDGIGLLKEAIIGVIPAAQKTEVVAKPKPLHKMKHHLQKSSVKKKRSRHYK